MPPLPFTIDLSALPDGKYKVTLQTDSGEDRSAVARNPFTTREVENRLALLGRQKQAITPLELTKTLRQFGSKLFSFLIRDYPEIYSPYLTFVQQGVRMRLSVDDAGTLGTLPWELMRDPQRDYLALSDSTLISRVSLGADQRMPIPILFPLRILVAVAGRAAEESWKHFETATAGLRRTGQIVIDRLSHVSLGDLRLQMLAEDFHIFHYFGFARSDDQTRQPLLVMRYRDRGFIRAEELNHELYAESTVRLAILTPCDDSFRPMSDFASRLHVPASSTLQFPLGSNASIVFYREFYGALVQGLPVDAAMSTSRRALANRYQGGQWAAPVLFCHAQDGQLFRSISGIRNGSKQG